MPSQLKRCSNIDEEQQDDSECIVKPPLPPPPSLAVFGDANDSEKDDEDLYSFSLQQQSRKRMRCSEAKYEQMQSNKRRRKSISHANGTTNAEQSAANMIESHLYDMKSIDLYNIRYRDFNA